MTKKYYKKKIKVRSYKKKNGTKVSGYERNQRFRKYDPISREKAIKLFEKRTKRSQSIDLNTTSNTLLDEPDEYWVEHMNRSDVKGIDNKFYRKIPKDKIQNNYKKIDFSKDYDNLVQLSKDFKLINDLLYSAEHLSKKEIEKLKQRRDALLDQRKKIKEDLKPKKFTYHGDGINIEDINDKEKYYGYEIQFDYNKYMSLSYHEREQWRKYGRWQPNKKVWKIYKDKADSAFELLEKNNLIDKKPQKTSSLQDLYLTKSEKTKDTIVIEIDDSNKIAKIDGNPNTIKKLDDFYSYYKKGYEYSKAYQDGKWDGKIHIINKDNTLPQNLAYNIVENKEDIDPDLNIKIVDFRKNAIREKPMELKDITLYDYQQKAVDKAIENQQGLIVVATGGGKTEIGAGIIAEYGEDNDSMFLVHTTALQDQAEKRLEQRLGVDVGTGGGTKHAIIQTKEGDVNVVTLQSLYQAIKKSNEGKELTKKQKELISIYKDAELIIEDEAHHVKAKTFKQVIDESNTKHIYGLTATPYRDENDEKEVYSRFGKKVVDINVDKLIGKKKLVAPVINIVDVPSSIEAKRISTKYYKSGSKKYKDIKQAQIIENEKRNEMIMNIAKEQENKGKTSLIFVDRIKHGEILSEMLNKPFLNGQKLTKKNRLKNQEIIEKVKKGEQNTIIATQQLFGEGFDLPAIDSLIIADAGGKSRVKAMQQTGRALRTKKGKTKTEIFDFRDNTTYLKDHANERIKTYKENNRFIIKEK